MTCYICGKTPDDDDKAYDRDTHRLVCLHHAGIDETTAYQVCWGCVSGVEPRSLRNGVCDNSHG